MSDTSANNKRIAKNTLLLYFRMLFLMLISLYTSRVILNILGVEDYGIYNLVGSIIAVFGSVRTLFASSTQRFMNAEMGGGNSKKLQVIFCISVYINIILSVLFVLLVEIFGLIFFQTKINIPSDRILAAQCVFHLSLVSSVVSIMTTPYDAAIIANERMDFFAFSSVLEGVLKLLIVFLLPIFETCDKLVMYGLLILAVQLSIRFLNAGYCKHYFPECHLKRCWDARLFRQMTAFAGWQFFGNTSFALTHNGINMVLNIFGGPVVNAARAVAAQVSMALGQFLSSITMAANPHLIKSYAEGKKQETVRKAFFLSKTLFFVQCCIVVPFMLFTRQILELWLVNVPQHTIMFLRIILIWSLVRSLHSPIDILFKASGYMKYYQLTEGIVLALPVPIGYIALASGQPFHIVFIISAIIEAINLLVVLFLAKRVMPFPLTTYVKEVLSACALLSLVLFAWLRLSTASCSVLGNVFLCTVAELSLLLTFSCILRRIERQQFFAIAPRFLQKTRTTEK